MIMMKFLPLSLFVVFAVIRTGDSINCFVCAGYERTCTKAKFEEARNTYIKTCDEKMDRCMRIWTDKNDLKNVTNACANKKICDTTQKECDTSSFTCKFSCCDKDECNAGSALSVSMFLMTACSMLGLALLK